MFYSNKISPFLRKNTVIINNGKHFIFRHFIDNVCEIISTCCQLPRRPKSPTIVSMTMSPSYPSVQLVLPTTPRLHLPRGRRWPFTCPRVYVSRPSVMSQMTYCPPCGMWCTGRHSSSHGKSILILPVASNEICSLIY